jgi:hypothetical protein
MPAPAALLRRAATVLRERAQAVPSRWPGRPWHVEECASEEDGGCPCIVAQGKRAAWDQAQDPPIQYVADAETPEHAAWIATVHPGVGLALADLLEHAAARLDHSTHPDWQELVAPHELAVARAVLAEPEEEQR